MSSERKRDPRHLPSAEERRKTNEPLNKELYEQNERKERTRAVKHLDGGDKRDA